MLARGQICSRMKIQSIFLVLSVIFSSSFAYAANIKAVSKQSPTAVPQPSPSAQIKKTIDPQLSLLAKGQAAFNARDYKRAFTIWHNLAQKGHPEAQVFVGLAYKNGWGVTKDQKQASMWFQMAAEGGNPSAQFFIGLQYLGSDNPKLVPIGINWLVQAARNGESNARQFLLKAKRRQWFPVPENFEVKARVTQVTASNIDTVFTGKPQTPDSTSASAEESLQQARMQIQQSGATVR